MTTIPALPATTDYRVWARVRSVVEEADALHVVAEFRFLQEALDYVRYSTEKHGADVVLTGPYAMVSIYPRRIA